MKSEPNLPGMGPLIRASNLSKHYRMFASPGARLFEALLRRPRHTAHVALEGVSFDLGRGESLGIVGENGAGKSTLLKLLAGVATPSSGSLQVSGRISAILELGSGFHPEFTGRQNIRINAALLGLDPGEVDQALPDIIAFSELAEFIDRPVKTYSTGMAMRLAFAIATQVDPDVLIVDEALSVGDGYFQKKCMDRMLALTEAGTTLLFCTHAMYYLTAFCERALWLRDGKPVMHGPAREVVSAYEAFLQERDPDSVDCGSAKGTPPSQQQLTERGNVARITNVTLPLPAGFNEPFAVDVEWHCEDKGRQFQVGIGLDRADGIQVGSWSRHLDGLAPLTGQTQYQLRFQIDQLPLVQGEFTLYVYLLDESGLCVFDQEILRSALHLESPDYRTGLVDAPHQWLALQSHPKR